MANKLTNALSKIFRVGTAPEGQARPTYGIGEFGGVFSVPFGNGWERGLSGSSTASNGTVYALVQCYAMALAASGLDNRKKTGKGGWAVQTNTAAYRALKNPNPAQTQVEFITYMVNSLFYRGNFYARVVRNDRNEISQLWPLPVNGSNSRAVISSDGEIYYDASSDYAFFRNGDMSQMVPARDMLHIKLPTGTDILKGETPISYAVQSMGLNTVLLDNASVLAMNGSQPSGVLSTELTLTPTQMTELREKFNEVSKGANRGGVPILGGGLKWQPMSVSAVDSQLVQTYNLTVIDLCRIFRVPPQMLGVEFNGTASSVESLINQWRASGLLFYCELIEASLERLFRMGPDEEFRFDLSNIARSDFKTEIDALAMAVQNAIFSPNEARNRVGMDSVPFGDEPRVQAQNVRLQDAKPAESAESAPVGPVTPESTTEDVEDVEEVEDEEEEITDEERKALFILRLEKSLEVARG